VKLAISSRGSAALPWQGLYVTVKGHLRMPFPPYRFRAVTPADLPLLRAWLWCGHVREWWGDPVHALARIAEHIVDPAIDPFMVECDDVPIGYVQSWDPHAKAGFKEIDRRMTISGEAVLMARDALPSASLISL
jgi:hypothetical protein